MYPSVHVAVISGRICIHGCITFPANTCPNNPSGNGYDSYKPIAGKKRRIKGYYP